MTLLFTIYYFRIHQKKIWSLTVIEAKIFMMRLRSKSDKKSVRLNGRDRFILGYLLVSKDSPKFLLGLYLLHKSKNVKLKLYLELS